MVATPKFYIFQLHREVQNAPFFSLIKDSLGQRPRVIIWQPTVAIEIMGLLREGCWQGR